MVNNEENLFWCKGPKQATANGRNVQSSRVSLKHCSGLCTEGAIPAARAETENPTLPQLMAFFTERLVSKVLQKKQKVLDDITNMAEFIKQRRVHSKMF